MRLDVYYTPGELAGAELPDGVVVIDVLRATSTMVEALANGARAVLPVPTADEAARIAQGIGRDMVLLCGERKGLPIEGFDLGNAPGEFTADRVEDMSLVMTTTNGTRAFLSIAEKRGGGGKADAEQVTTLAASFLNLGATAERLAGATAVTIVCAGREGRFALEDAVCAGALVRRLEADGTVELNDGAVAARALAGRHMKDLVGMMEATAAGRHLVSIGRAEDLVFCAEVDRVSVTPRFRDRKISLE